MNVTIRPPLKQESDLIQFCFARRTTEEPGVEDDAFFCEGDLPGTKLNRQNGPGRTASPTHLVDQLQEGVSGFTLTAIT